jgi:hypothetical protein
MGSEEALDFLQTLLYRGSVGEIEESDISIRKYKKAFASKSASKYVTFRDLLKNGIINVSEYLKYSIRVAFEHNDVSFFAIGVSLNGIEDIYIDDRNACDSEDYIPNMSVIHYIIEEYKSANSDNDVLKKVLNLLAFTSNYYPDKKYIDDTKFTNSEYLSDIFDDYQDLGNLNEYVDIDTVLDNEVDYIVYLSVLTDNIEFIDDTVESISVLDMEKAIIMHSNVVLEHYVKNGILDSYYIYCNRSYNNVGFLTMLQTGILPRYSTVNRIILWMKHLKDDENMYGYLSLKNNLLNSIVYGYDIDTHQLELVRSFDSETAELIERIYNLPSWVTECSSSKSKFSEKMVRDLYYIGLYDSNDNPSKSQVCRALAEEFRDSNVDEIMSSLVKRVLVTYPDVTISDIRSYRTDVPLNGGNILDVLDYTDEEGKRWVFTSDDFSFIRSKKLNPYNGKKLPKDVINVVREKRNFSHSLGIPIKPAKTFEEAYSSLKSGSTINNEKYDEAKDRIHSTGRLSDISESDWNSLEIEDMVRILKEIGINHDLTVLDEEHAKSTFYIEIYDEIRRGNTDIFEIVSARID